jgi:hypothetical protein
LNKFQDQIGEDNYFSRLRNAYSITGQCVGKVDGGDVKVKYVAALHNPAELTMHIRVEAAPSGGSVIHTRYTISLFGKLFLILTTWALCSFAWITVTGTASGMYMVQSMLLGLVVMRLYAYREQSKLEKLLHNVIKTVEAEQRGEKVF